MSSDHQGIVVVAYIQGEGRNQDDFIPVDQMMRLLGRLFPDHKSIAEFEYLTVTESLPRPTLATRKVSSPFIGADSPQNEPITSGSFSPSIRKQFAVKANICNSSPRVLLRD
jgi:hypothetical protein